MVAGVRFELTTFGLCGVSDCTFIPRNGMLAIQSLPLPRTSEAWFGIAIAQQQASGSTDFDE